jgi:hypothetical protein
MRYSKSELLALKEAARDKFRRANPHPIPAKLFIIRRSKANAVSLLIFPSSQQCHDVTYAAATLLGITANFRNPNYVTINYDNLSNLVERLNAELGSEFISNYELI